MTSDAWRAEIPSLEQHFSQFKERLPVRMKQQLDALKERLGK